MERHRATIHGRRLAYRTAGEDGPTVLLIHGITQDASTWEELSEHLSGHARLLAPDLPGHGDSDNPPGDHSLGAYASIVRDLLLTIERERVTLVGHSLGGGVALQFAYQFPDMIERLVLIDSGGLGRDVSRLLRAAALPGAEPVLALLSTDSVRSAVASLAQAMRRLGLRAGTDLEQAWKGIEGLADADARRAFLATVKAVIGLSGQRVSARDRLYLAEHVPTLILWGADDRIIPLHHATAAHGAIPGSRLEVLEHAGHFPHLDDPRGVARAIAEFLEATEPADVPRERWGEILRAASAGTAAS